MFEAISELVAKPIGIDDAVSVESAAPPRATSPTSANLSFILILLLRI
jgi:hypothetical protein